MATKIEKFFTTIENTWNVIPDWFKVFFYSVISSVIGLYLAKEQIDLRSVVYILAVNLGIYIAPRKASGGVRTLMK